MTVTDLIAALNDPDAVARRDVREALTTLGAQAIPALVNALQSSEHTVRWEALKALETVADASAVPALLGILDDEDFGIRWMAAEILGGLGDDGLIPLLLAFVHDNGSSWMTDSVHHALRFYRGDFTDELDQLLEKLHSNNDFSYITWAAGQALRSLENRRRRAAG